MSVSKGPVDPSLSSQSPLEGLSADGFSESDSPTKLNPRQELEQKKEKLRGRSRDPKILDESRFDKLYSDALKRHLTTQLKADTEKDKDASFAPRLATRGRSASRGSSTSRGSSRERNEPFHERLGATASPKSKSGPEEKELTFKPTISKRAKSIERKELKDPAERLYHHNKFLKEKMERKKTEAELRELESCTFAPTIISKRNSTAAGDDKEEKDLIERMNNFEEARQQRREKIQKELEEKQNANLTFQPHLPARRSATPTKSKAGTENEPVYDRLSKPVERVVDEDPNLTFQPKIVTKRGPSPGPAARNSDVHERLFRDGVQKKREAEVRQVAMRESLEHDLTFKPVLLTVEKEKKETEEDKQTFMRRVQEDVAHWSSMRESLQKTKEDMELRDCTFTPKIHATVTSSKPNDDKPLYDRLVHEQDRVHRELERKREELERRELEGATFAPELPRNSISMAARRSEGGGSDVYQRLSVSMTQGTLSRMGSHQSALSIDGSTSASSHAPVVPPSPQMPKEELDKVFSRLSSPTPERRKEMSSPAVEPKKIIMPAAQVEKVVDRLNKSFTKSDLESLIAAERAAVKEPLRVPGSSIDKIFDRVANRSTVASMHQEAPNAHKPNDDAGATSPAARLTVGVAAAKKRAPSPAHTPTAKSPVPRPAATPRTPASTSPKPVAHASHAAAPGANGAANGATPVKVATPKASATPTVKAKPTVTPASKTSRSAPVPAARSELPTPPPKALRGRIDPATVTPTPPAPPSTAVKHTPASAVKPKAGAPAGKDDFLAKLESSLTMLGLDINGQPLAKAAQPPAASAATAPAAAAATAVSINTASAVAEAVPANEDSILTPVISPASRVDTFLEGMPLDVVDDMVDSGEEHEE